MRREQKKRGGRTAHEREDVPVDLAADAGCLCGVGWCVGVLACDESGGGVDLVGGEREVVHLRIVSLIYDDTRCVFHVFAELLVVRAARTHLDRSVGGGRGVEAGVRWLASDAEEREETGTVPDPPWHRGEGGLGARFIAARWGR